MHLIRFSKCDNDLLSAFLFKTVNMLYRLWFFFCKTTLLFWILELSGYYCPLYLLCTATQVSHPEFRVAGPGLLCCGWQQKLCECVCVCVHLVWLAYRVSSSLPPLEQLVIQTLLCLPRSFTLETLCLSVCVCVVAHKYSRCDFCAYVFVQNMMSLPLLVYDWNVVFIAKQLSLPVKISIMWNRQKCLQTE